MLTWNKKKDECRKSYIAKHAIITNSRWKILMKIIQSINSWYSDYQNQRAHNFFNLKIFNSMNGVHLKKNQHQIWNSPRIILKLFLLYTLIFQQSRVIKKNFFQNRM